MSVKVLKKVRFHSARPMEQLQRVTEQNWAGVPNQEIQSPLHSPPAPTQLGCYLFAFIQYQPLWAHTIPTLCTSLHAWHLQVFPASATLHLSSRSVMSHILDMDKPFWSGLRPRVCSVQFSLLFTSWLSLLPHSFYSS